MSRGLAVGIFIWVVSIVIGVNVGKRKGRRKAAEWLTIFLGPVGLITVLRLPESREAKIAEVQWADSGRCGKSERAPEPTRSADATFSPLRLIIIVFALLAATAGGFYFKSQANPGREPSSFGSHSPLYLNVFETNPDFHVAVNVTLSPTIYPWHKLPTEGLVHVNVTVYVTARGPRSGSPGKMFITSSVAPDPSVPQRLIPVEHASGAQRFVVQLSPSRDSNGTWSDIAFFDAVPIILENNGSTFGHLPSIGTLENPIQNTFGSFPPLFVEYGHATGKARYATVNYAPPHARWLGIAEIADVSSWVTVPGDYGEFYGSSSEDISCTETLQQVVPVLAGQLLDYIAPAMDNGGSNDYVWHSQGNLEPVFKDTNPDATDSQSQAAFYSGIAFGLAGAAIIALVQEIPEERERKSSTSSAQNSASNT